jgi:outer membrane protein OmpA-like peptidoglycan-associated protein
MKIHLAVVSAILLPSLASAAPGDKPGCSDHPLFPTRLPDYRITDCKVTEYDSVRFLKMKAPERTEEGKVTYLFYQRPPNQGAAAIEIVRNYENALQKIGATIVDVDDRHFVYGKVVQDGREVWAQAEARPGGMIRLYVVEKKPMAQHVVADAAAFSKDLTATGHVAVYGIYFDTAKSEIKPESTPALEEVAKLLASDPGLKLWVVGHTDGVGAIDANMRLSQARADAVVAALTTNHKVGPARLKGYGVGPLAPVASNAAEDGRARNRRVELVRQ